jgi:hypothetical protein
MSNFLTIVNGYPRLVPEAGSSAIYDQSVVLVSPVSTGTPYTLPASGNYVGDELEVYLDGQVLDSGSDFTFVGSGTKTQVTFTFDLLAGDNIRFRKIRGA